MAGFASYEEAEKYVRNNQMAPLFDDYKTRAVDKGYVESMMKGDMTPITMVSKPKSSDSNTFSRRMYSRKYPVLSSDEAYSRASKQIDPQIQQIKNNLILRLAQSRQMQLGNLAERGQAVGGARNLAEANLNSEEALQNANIGLQGEMDKRALAEQYIQQSREDARNAEALDYQRAIDKYNMDRQSRMDALEQERQTRSDYAENIGAYASDYMAEINRIKGDNDPSNDWMVGYLNNARNQKLAEIQTAKAEAEQQAFENELKMKDYLLDQAKTNYEISKPYYKPVSASASAGAALKDAEKEAKYQAANQRKYLQTILDSDYSTEGEKIWAAGQLLGRPSAQTNISGSIESYKNAMQSMTKDQKLSYLQNLQRNGVADDTLISLLNFFKLSY